MFVNIHLALVVSSLGNDTLAYFEPLGEVQDDALKYPPAINAFDES